MAKSKGVETSVIESAESTENLEQSTGGEETNVNSGESSTKNATGNFLTDLLEGGGDENEAESGGEDDGKGGKKDSAGTTGATTKGAKADEITAEMAGDEIAAGDTLYKGGKPIVSGTFKSKDGTVYKTDAKGVITEITTAEEEEETESEDTEEEDEESEEGLFELKHDDEVEKFDLTKKEDLEKVREYAQKGRVFEKNMAVLKKDRDEFTAEQEEFGTRQTSMAHNLLYLQTQGKVNAEEFVELPYETFIGSSAKKNEAGEVTDEATTEGDITNWNNHKKVVASHNQVLQNYQANFKKTSAGYKKMVEDFGAKHPEIKDVKKWINENLGPYSASVLTYGAEQYQPDTLEMVHWWKNKANWEKNIREEERRKKAKVKVQEDKNKSKAGTMNGSAVDSFLSTALGADSRKIVH